jgi:hypothetical protein
MLPRLAAEEELLARAAASHPHLEGKDQSRHIARLAQAAGVAEPARKPSRADLASIGIRDVTGEDSSG